MTQVFGSDGQAIPVTVVEAGPCMVLQKKTVATDGYDAIQLGFAEQKEHLVNKPMKGHFAKAGGKGYKFVREFRTDSGENFDLGQELKADVFNEGEYVDVTGISRGKGFAGVIKRHHFNSQDASHGNSLSHRAPGSIGQRQSPGKVFKGKRMAGHMGDVNRTILSQEIVKIDLERNLVHVRGAVPGAPNSYVIIRPAVKKSA